MSAGFIPEQPVYGPGRGTTNSARPIKRYVRTYRVLQCLSRLRFETCLDVGGAEGYTAALIERQLEARCAVADARPEALAFAREHYGLPGVAIDAHHLPFRTGSFDVVLSTETVEHLPHPVEAMLEMARVARKAVLVSTCEARPSRCLSWFSRKLADYGTAGGHINFFTAQDFRSVLGGPTRALNQLIKPGLSRSSSQLLRYGGSDRDEILDGLRRITWTDAFIPGSRGIVAFRVLDPRAERERPTLDDDAILEAILDHVLEPGTRGAGTGRPGGWLHERLACPSCLLSLEEGPPFRCPSCGLEAGTEEGVPILRPIPRRLDTFDRERYQGTLEKVGLTRETVEATKKRLETRRGVTSPRLRSALRLGRRTVQTLEGVRRTAIYLGSRKRERPSVTAESRERTTEEGEGWR